MKKLIFTLGMILTSVIAFSQTTLKIKSGDTELDASLTEINVSAEKDFGIFKTEMNATYKVAEVEIDQLKTDFGMQASDIFMTLEISKSTGKSLDVVAAEFKKSKAEGWGVIAKNLGIKPGSDEFHALKGKAKTKGKSTKGTPSKKKMTTTKTMNSKGKSGKKTTK